jgi:hypothetical protein
MWREIVEGGQHRFECSFGGIPLTITKSEVPDAWYCILPSGQRLIGELRTVRWLAESVMLLRYDCSD